MKIYPKPNMREEDSGFTASEIVLGHIWLYADVTCEDCGKEQTAAAAGSIVDGKCIKCGGRTK